MKKNRYFSPDRPYAQRPQICVDKILPRPRRRPARPGDPAPRGHDRRPPRGAPRHAAASPPPAPAARPRSETQRGARKRGLRIQEERLCLCVFYLDSNSTIIFSVHFLSSCIFFSFLFRVLLVLLVLIFFPRRTKIPRKIENVYCRDAYEY